LSQGIYAVKALDRWGACQSVDHAHNERNDLQADQQHWAHGDPGANVSQVSGRAL